MSMSEGWSTASGSGEGWVGEATGSSSSARPRVAASCAQAAGHTSGVGGVGGRSSPVMGGGEATAGGARSPGRAGGGAPAGETWGRDAGCPRIGGEGGGGRTSAAPGSAADRAAGGCAASRSKASRAKTVRRRRTLRLCKRDGCQASGAAAAAGVEVGRKGGNDGTRGGRVGATPTASSARGRSCTRRRSFAGRPAPSRGDDAGGRSCARWGEAKAEVASASSGATRRRVMKFRLSFRAMGLLGGLVIRVGSSRVTVPGPAICEEGGAGSEDSEEVVMRDGK